MTRKLGAISIEFSFTTSQRFSLLLYRAGIGAMLRYIDKDDIDAKRVKLFKNAEDRKRNLESDPDPDAEDLAVLRRKSLLEATSPGGSSSNIGSVTARKRRALGMVSAAGFVVDVSPVTFLSLFSNR
jgi:hypothetical protein